jgi:hypothetical protein
MKAMPLIVTLALGLLVAPLTADAQQPAKMPRIGFLAFYRPRCSAGTGGRQASRAAGGWHYRLTTAQRMGRVEHS